MYSFAMVEGKLRKSTVVESRYMFLVAFFLQWQMEKKEMIEVLYVQLTF